MQFLDIKAVARKTFRCWWKRNAWLEQLWQNCFFLSVCCALLCCLFLERKGFIPLNVIVWELFSSRKVTVHAEKVQEADTARALRWTSQMPPIDTCMSRLFCLTYIHSLYGQNTSLFLV